MDNKKKIPRNSLGLKIKEARENKSFDTLKLAELMGKLNVTEKMILEWENGKILPNLDQIYKLAEILDLNPNEMLEIKNEINKSSVKEPNFAARRVGGKILNAAEPTFRATSYFIQILAVVCVVLVGKYIHSAFDVMDAPLVHQVENTLDNALEINEKINENQINNNISNSFDNTLNDIDIE